MHHVILHTQYDNMVTEYDLNDCMLLLEKPKRTVSQEKKTTKSTVSKIKHGIGARCTIFNKIIHNITLNTFINNGVQVILCRTLFWSRKYKIKYATEFSCWKIRLFPIYMFSHSLLIVLYFFLENYALNRKTVTTRFMTT